VFPNLLGAILIGYNQLTSLEGCPKSVGGGFYCQREIPIKFGRVGGDFPILNILKDSIMDLYIKKF
jgi:hypothetical protein